MTPLIQERPVRLPRTFCALEDVKFTPTHNWASSRSTENSHGRTSGLVDVFSECILSLYVDTDKLRAPPLSSPPSNLKTQNAFTATKKELVERNNRLDITIQGQLSLQLQQQHLIQQRNQQIQELQRQIQQQQEEHREERVQQLQQLDHQEQQLQQQQQVIQQQQERIQQQQHSNHGLQRRLNEQAQLNMSLQRQLDELLQGGNC